MSDAVEMKPCPFCGSTNTTDWGEGTWSRPVKWWYCCDCLAQGPRVMSGRGEDEPAWMARVVSEWNTRADLATAAVAAAREEGVRLGLLAAIEQTALLPLRVPADPRLAYHAALDAVEAHIRALAADPEQVARIAKGDADG